MQGRGGLQALAALRGWTRRLGVPRQPARDRRVPAVAGRARVREGERRSAYRHRHLGRRHPARQRCPLSGPRFPVPPHSACRQQSSAGGWIVRAPGARASLFNYHEGAKHGEEKSQKRRQEKEEEESIRKEEENVEKSGKQKGGSKEIRQEKEKGGKKEK